MIESIERMRKLVNDNLVMGLRFQMNGELNKLESEIEQELNTRAEQTCELIETDKYTNSRETIHVLECSECGETCEHVNGIYSRCPNCGAKVVDEGERQ